MIKPFKHLELEVNQAYENANVSMSNQEMLSQIKSIQSSFNDYMEVASKIKAKFKERDLQLFADLSDINPNYCKMEAESDEMYTYLAFVQPALAPLILLQDKEVVFKLKNYGDLRDLNDSLSKEEFKIKKNKSKSKRYLRKLRYLKEELTF
jgi:hypothetical protein